MLIIASSNGAIGIDKAMNTLKNGGSALDAVETGIRLVEANPAEHSVGYNGYPNILGELELDASIVDGRSLNSGAVALMRGFPYAISVARQVMERALPHVLLAGAGAERFAREIEAEQWEEMLTEEIRAVWRDRLADVGAAAVARQADDALELRDEAPLLNWVKLTTDPERVLGTVNFIAIDSAGDISSGISTSGWAWKYPGRIGDSPIIGAGNYADNRYGACACTGMGEMAIRAGTRAQPGPVSQDGHVAGRGGSSSHARSARLGRRFYRRHEPDRAGQRGEAYRFVLARWRRLYLSDRRHGFFPGTPTRSRHDSDALGGRSADVMVEKANLQSAELVYQQLFEVIKQKNR